MNTSARSPFFILLMNVIAIIVAYYVSILLHEWSHGTLAWINGVKQNPFDIQYGGYCLMHADENVNYMALIISGRGIAAGIIGIAGLTISFILAVFCFILLHCRRIQKSPVKLIFSFWFLIINMIPLVQYFSISTFSYQGDVGRFIYGLNIAAWWIFIPGTIFNIIAIARILKIEIPKCYLLIPIRSLLAQSIFLLTSLSIMFLFIYLHGYNPLSDPGMPRSGKLLSIASIFLVPMLFALCLPSQRWVKNAVKKQQTALT